MPLRHVVVLTFADTATADQRQAVLDGLATLPGLIPEIGSYWFGADAGLAEGNGSVTVVADFASVEDWQTYTAHPDHRRVIEERILPILESRTAIQVQTA